MEALVCDVCGGKLVMQAGKIAKCEYCGLEYSTESLREKVLEIKGTVNVQGIATAENILIRAKNYEKDGDYEKAVEYYDKYLDLNPIDEEIKSKIAFIKEEKVRCQQEGALCKGKIVRTEVYAVFVRFYGGIEGMIHISKLYPRRINNAKDVVAVGDELWCVCLGRDKMGRLSYSAKDGRAFENNLQCNQKYNSFHVNYVN